MRLRVSEAIKHDLHEIALYIAKHNPTRAVTFVKELKAAIREVGKTPLIHRLRPDVGIDARMAVHRRYLILFRIEGDTVYVVSGARDLSTLERDLQNFD